MSVTNSILSTVFIILLSVNLSQAQRDTIWTVYGEIIPCTIESHVLDMSILKISKDSSQARIPLSNISKVKWNNRLTSVGTAWMSLDCTDLPFMGKDEKYKMVFTHHIRLQNQSYYDLFKIFKELATVFWGNEKLFNIQTDQSKSNVTIIENKYVQVYDDMSAPIDIGIKITSRIHFTNHEITFNSEIEELKFPGGWESPKIELIDGYKKKNGKVKKFNFRICEHCNNLIAQHLSTTLNLLEDAGARVRDIEWLAEWRTAFEEYLKTHTLHPLEGIWSADVTLPDGGHYSQFDVAIFREGGSLTIVPLSVYYPRFDNSVKYLEPTAEPSIFLLKAKFSGSNYVSEGRLQLQSPAIAKFSIQVPESKLMNYLVENDLKYTGDRRVTYNLVKKVSSSPKKSEQNGSMTYTGTGFAVSSSGLIVTNHHVVEAGSNIIIKRMNGNTIRTAKATVVASDKPNDLVLLRVDPNELNMAEAIPYSIADEDMKMGMSVYSIGYPKPTQFNGNIVVTNGIISSSQDPSRYQMTVRLTFGNSGGPIFNNRGEVVGVSSAGTHDLSNLAATYSIKSKHLSSLVRSSGFETPVATPLPVESLEDRLDLYSQFVYLIEVTTN
jgi:S1-C subfamily serine protease